MLGFANFLISVLSSGISPFHYDRYEHLDASLVGQQLAHALLSSNKIAINTNKAVSALELVHNAWYLSQALQDLLDNNCTQVCFEADDHYDFICVLIALAFLDKDVLLKTKLNDQANLLLNTVSLGKQAINSAFKIAQELKLKGELKVDNDSLVLSALRCQSKIFVYTSGSSGEPKAIVKTFDIMLHEVALFANKIKLNPHSVVLTTVSPFHLYGLSFTVFMPLCCGLTIVNTKIQVPEDLCSYQSHSCVLVSSPAFLSRLDYNVPALDFSLVLSAGGPLSYEVAQNFFKWSNTCVSEIYGSSETGIIATRQIGDKAHNFEAFSSLEFLKQDGISYLKSPLIYEGQLKLDDDLEFIDDKTFVIKGRRDRVVKIGDKRFNLAALENKLKEHPKVLDVALVTLNLAPLEDRQELKRERLGALIALEEPQIYEDKLQKLALVKELKELIRGSYDSLAIPRYWRFCHAIPVNSMGKRVSATIKQYFAH